MGRTVLIVDDDQEILDSFQQHMEPEPYEVITANAGLDGWNLYKEKNVDLVICDLVMPGMGGIEFLTKVRAEGKTPFFILTSALTSGFYKICIESGVTDIFQKPIDFQFIKLRVKSSFD